MYLLVMTVIQTIRKNLDSKTKEHIILRKDEVPMIVFQKQKDKDFTILNLTDIHTPREACKDGKIDSEILTYTISELVERVKPDLITVTGDFAYAHGDTTAYEYASKYLDSFGIPWAPVWGNHDNQAGPEFVDRLVEIYKEGKHILYESGEASLGNGNYVIAIEEEGKVVEGLIMMDGHDEMPYVNEKGESVMEWAKLLPEQMDWYREQVKALSERGCDDTTMMLHIPIYAYRDAFKAAMRSDIPKDAITPELFQSGECWNEGYKDSTGMGLESIGSYPEDDGVFEVIKEMKTTKRVITGHDHVNDWMINYQGVKLIFSLKTGPHSYWRPFMCGGTVLRVTSEGVADVHHEYVDIMHLLKE